MKKKWKPVCLALILIMLVQLACTIEDVAPDYFCEMRGGIWHGSTPYEDGWCEMPKKPAPIPQSDGGSEGQPLAPQLQPDATASEGGATPIPAPIQECNATGYIHPLIEIVKNTQEKYYRECHYKLNLFNVHSEGIWILRHTNVSVHSSVTNTDDSYWYSDLKFPGQSWEYVFRSSYYTDGQTSREGVDLIAGVYNRPECLWILTSEEVEVISQSIEWACGP